ncbi:Fatty-acid-binding protein 3 protein [Thalictrum thalictroides]|uniref:Chalcone-flavonone isomerase family protein n=1 Tax=Thalictrum thalictroides TaxID=46969 RepID=A0A7J6X0M6_THATH|nr:Fatty-acid-binding protein 3 protein [Thalictrum thalictroides]
MASVVVGLSSNTSVTLFSSLNICSYKLNLKPKIFSFQQKNQICLTLSLPLSTFSTSCYKNSKRLLLFPKAAAASSSSSVENGELIVEPTTNVKFQSLLSLPGCSSPLALVGTGYREKVFAIIGVKVYAVGLYANISITESLNAWRSRTEAEYQEDPSFFNSIYQAPMEKALQIVLVRDIDGKTFWDALDSAITPRIKTPIPVDESALSKFRSIFQQRSLKKGTLIFLTWPDPSKMLVSISSDGSPSTVDATIEATNVNLALFDIFFGDAPVSPSLKAAVCNGFAKILR